MRVKYEHGSEPPHGMVAVDLDYALAVRLNGESAILTIDGNGRRFLYVNEWIAEAIDVWVTSQFGGMPLREFIAKTQAERDEESNSRRAF